MKTYLIQNNLVTYMSSIEKHVKQQLFFFFALISETISTCENNCSQV